MKRIVVSISLILFLFGCQEKKEEESDYDDFTSFLSYDPFFQINFNLYSKQVKDTFNIFVCLPKSYKKSDKKYPVVYILDANVAFEMISILMKLLSNGLECKEAIYVGIGYKDILEMDSLRGRDYSFPPDSTFGCCGALVFSEFLEYELIPEINNKYKTLQDENTLIGHSLGGYFVMYNLLQSALSDNLLFKNYIAGSPFIGNDKLFIDLEQKLSYQADSLPVKLFMCSGTIDDTDSLQIVIADLLRMHDYKRLEYKSIILEDFDHMDALIPTWSKGLRYILSYQ